MPRVVPSQVVALIDQVFPAARNQEDSQQGRFSVDRTYQNELAAIVELVSQIPSELITLEPESYTSFQLAITAIKNTIPTWSYRNLALERIHGYGNLNPVTIIRNALAECSDERIAQSSAELAFIADPVLRTSLRIDLSSADQAFQNGEWKAATMLAGATAEALLLYAVQSVQDKDPQKLANAVSTALANKLLSRDPGTDPETWSLHPLIEVALTLKAIADETAIQTRLARDFRNLIHPGRAIRKG